MRKICYVVTLPLTVRAFFIPQLKHLVEKGFNITVICSYEESLQKLLGDKIRYIALDIPRGIAFRASLSIIKQLELIFRKEKFDLVQYSTPNAAFYASIAAKKARIKLRNYHLMGFRYLGAKGIGRLLLKTLEKITCKNSTSIECVSQSNLNLGLRDKIFPSGKACVVWNGSTGGIDLRRFDFAMKKIWRSEVRAEIGYSDSDFVFGFVGRITKDKGINELLDAYFRLGGNSRLFLIGDLEDRDTLDQELLQKAQNSENIILHQSAADIERYYAMLDVLVLPSYREGFGNVVIEAAAMGTAAIVSNIPGPIDASLENKTAYWVKVRDVASLEQAMRQCLCDPSALEKMSSACLGFVQTHFDQDILNQKIVERKETLLEMCENSKKCAQEC